MNGMIAILAAGTMLGIAATGAADRSFCELKSGKMSASFNCDADGLSVTYGGVQIIRNSSMWVHNPSWTFHYYGLPHMKDAIVVRDVDGGREAVLTHRSAEFEAEERITVRENQLIRRLDFKLTKDVKDADLEYCFGTLCAAPILGRPFSAVMGGGKHSAGTVPVHCKIRDSWNAQLTPEPLKSIAFDSRIGKITIDVSGDPGTIIVMDYRLSQYESTDARPVFWAGTSLHLEYGKHYRQVITLTIGPLSDKPEREPAGPAEAVATKHDDVRAPLAGQLHVIPEPQQMKLTDADFRLDKNTVIVVGETAYSEDYRGAQSFAEEVRLLYGFEPKIVRESAAILRQAQDAQGCGVILVGETALNKMLAEAAQQEGISAPDKDEGYALKVTPKRVLVLGHDRAGTFYGMQTLKQLLKPSSEGVAIQGCDISDWPSLRFRGVHLFTGSRAYDFHKKLIDRILTRYKLNNIILEVDFIKWKSAPEIAVPFSEDQADIKREIDYARRNFIEINPLLQSLGHCDHLFMAGKNKDIAENPDRPYSYCVSNPRTYPYVFKLYDEVIELFGNPRFVHIGHDEVTEPGGFPRCEQCKKRSAEEIFVDDTLKMHEHLAKAGARIMMWGDMMLARGDAPDATNAKSAESAKWIRDRVPKDVVITDWHYAAANPEEYKSLDVFMREGYDTIAATWYTPANIEAFANQAKKVGAMGLLQTTWAGFESSEDNLKASFNQFSAFVLAAEFAWNSGRTDLEHLPYNADEEFLRAWNPRPIDVTPRRGFTLDLSRLYNSSLADTPERLGWMGLGPDHDLSAAPTGEARLRGDLFKLADANTKPSCIRLASALDVEASCPSSVTIAVKCKASALLFLHTCLWRDTPKRTIGSYRINYSDGTSETVDLAYGVNIVAFNDQRSLANADRVWSGRTRDDERVSLVRMQWDNPHPNKQIESVEFTSAKTEAGPVLIAVSGLE